VSSFRIAWIKLTFSFLKHLKLGLKTIPYFNILFSNNFKNVKHTMQQIKKKFKSVVSNWRFCIWRYVKKENYVILVWFSNQVLSVSKIKNHLYSSDSKTRMFVLSEYIYYFILYNIRRTILTKKKKWPNSLKNMLFRLKQKKGLAVWLCLIDGIWTIRKRKVRTTECTESVLFFHTFFCVTEIKIPYLKTRNFPWISFLTTENEKMRFFQRNCLFMKYECWFKFIYEVWL